MGRGGGVVVVEEGGEKGGCIWYGVFEGICLVGGYGNMGIALFAGKGFHSEIPRLRKSLCEMSYVDQ